LQQHFVALAADCDDPEHEVDALARKVPNASMLPFVILADSAGRYVEGRSGAIAPDVLKAMLERAIG
jgi:hypothetical protein